MKSIPDKSIDLTVTSPPYDNLRTYNGTLIWNDDIWKAVLQDLYRVTKDGGVVVWVVGDATIKGSETGTSFKQALYAKDCGFNLHDTMIYAKQNYIPLSHNRYEQQFEFMFVFSKSAPKSFNPLKIPTLNAGATHNRTKSNKEAGSSIRNRDEITVVKSEKIKPNIWTMSVSAQRLNHPAIFPESLARDHIISWSNEGDTVLDCFMGSGTTGKMAVENKRNFIGIEKDETYFNIAKERIERAEKEYKFKN